MRNLDEAAILNDSRQNGQQVLLTKLQQEDKSVKFEADAEKQHIPLTGLRNAAPRACPRGLCAMDIWAHWEPHYWHDGRMWEGREEQQTQ